MKSTVSLQYEYIYHFRSYNSVFRHLWWGLQGELSIRGWSHRAVPTPSVSISGCNSEKMVGNHLFLNIIPSNFTAKTERKVWCDRGMRVYDSMNLQWIPLAPMHKSEQLTIHSNLVGRSHPSTWVVGSGSINESATSNKNNNIVFSFLILHSCHFQGGFRCILLHRSWCVTSIRIRWGKIPSKYLLRWTGRLHS